MQQHIVTFYRFLFPSKCSGCNIFDKTCKLNAENNSLASNWTITFRRFAILQYCIYFCGDIQSYLSGQFWDVITTQLLHIVLFLKRFTFWHYHRGPSDQWGLGCVANWSNSAFDSRDFSGVTLVYHRDVYSLHCFSHSGKWMYAAVSRFRKHRNQIPSLSGVELATTQAMLFNKSRTVDCNFLCGNNSIL